MLLNVLMIEIPVNKGKLISVASFSNKFNGNLHCILFFKETSN